VGAAETDRQIIQKVTILWRSGSTLSTRSGSNDYYTGHISEFSIEGAEYAEVYFADPDTGERLRAVDPEVLDGNALTMVGTGASTTYDLTVTGSIEPDSDALEDTISGSSASGQVGRDSDSVDTFYFTGDVAELVVRGSSEVSFQD